MLIGNIIMQLICPKCETDVPPEVVNIQTDLAQCANCGEIFKVSDALGISADDLQYVPGEAPPASRVAVEDSADGGLNLGLSAPGLGGKSVPLFLFSLAWNAILIVVAGSFVYGMIQGQVPWLMVLFFVPFVAVGVGMPFFACWLAWGSTALRLAPEGVAVIRILFGIRRVKSFPLDKIKPFSHVVAYRQNYQPVHACCMNGPKKIKFGHHLDTDEQLWVIARLNTTLRGLQRNQTE